MFSLPPDQPSGAQAHFSYVRLGAPLPQFPPPARKASRIGPVEALRRDETEALRALVLLAQVG